MTLNLTDEHRYFDETGREYDGTTTIIKGAGLMKSTDFIDTWYLTRGEAVHNALELYAKGMLDESSVDPRIVGFVESGKHYIDEHPCPPEYIEMKLGDNIYYVGGKIDRLDCDFKTGGKEAWHIYQCAEYRDLLKVNKLPYVQMNKTVYLQEDGSPAIPITYTVQQLSRALQTFKCAVVIYRARKEDKII